MVGEEIKYERIDGSISGKYRQEAIDRFNCKYLDQNVWLINIICFCAIEHVLQCFMILTFR